MKSTKRQWKCSLLLVFMTLLLSCSKVDTAAPVPATSSVSSQVASIKEAAKEAINSPIVNTTKAAVETTTQTVFVPINTAAGEVITPNYKSPCLLQNYRLLNIWCHAWDFGHNQAKLISWYIPYGFIFWAFVVAIIVIWWIGRRIKRGSN